MALQAYVQIAFYFARKPVGWSHEAHLFSFCLQRKAVVVYASMTSAVLEYGHEDTLISHTHISNQPLRRMCLLVRVFTVHQIVSISSSARCYSAPLVVTIGPTSNFSSYYSVGINPFAVEFLVDGHRYLLPSF